MQPTDIPGYRPIRKIEKGGMTDLYVARNAENERVVIRFIREEGLKDRRIKKAFKNGAGVLEKLDHPNVVRILQRGTHRGRPFVVVEYHESLNLRECIMRRDPITEKYPIHLIRDIANGLDYIHRQGYLHMDLKPENILVRPDHRCIFVDFDLSMDYRGKPIKLKEIPGTPTYLAPETLRERVVEQRSEIYSFGVAVFELLTRHKPYLATTPKEYQREVVELDRPVIPVKTYRKDISRGLEKVVLKCLAKRVDQRYPSMSLVRRDIEALII